MNKVILTIVVVIFTSSFLCGGLLHAQDKTKGNIYGDVRLKGELPKGKGPSIVEYQGPCGAKKSLSVVSLWKDRILDVVLWITSTEPVASASPSDDDNLNIIGHRCEFWPKMILARPGEVIKVANEDPYTQWLVIEETGNRKRQVLQESGSAPVEITVKEDIKIHLLSAFYPWMEAWIQPVPTLVATTETDWDGRFYFKDIEPGKYILHSWHPLLGETSQEVVVDSDEVTDVEVEYQTPESQLPIIEPTMLEELFGKPEDAKDDNPFNK